MLLAVDPGANTGWAVFDTSRQLVGCGLGVPGPASWAGGSIRRVVIERPHTGRTRAPAKDIITLAIRAGEAGGRLYFLTGVTPEYIEPQVWKGQIPKARCNEIVKSRLSSNEAALLEDMRPRSAVHNVLDAIGIGLYKLDRIRGL